MDTINQAVNMIGEQLEVGKIAWLVLFGLLFVVAFVVFFRGIYIYSKRSVESAHFMIFCVPVFVWAFLIIAGPLFGLDNGPGTLAQLGIITADTLIPVLMMFHIWSQISYRPITALSRFLWLVIPVALIVFEAFDFYDPGLNFNLIFFGRVSLMELVKNVYFIVVIVKSYLLCFNVFYQMPKHMRTSTHQMIIAITALLMANIISLYFSAPENIHNVILVIAYIIAIGALYKAFFMANSSNVIVTSRDFVFSNLSTLVITVSLKGNILDWNKKDKGACLPLPDPKYKEPYSLYRKRIMEVCKATISKYDENIINIVREKGENQFLFTWHEISYFGRKFGYLVEISDVSKVFAKLRYIEEIAYYDRLTALHNRNAYIEKVKDVVKDENLPLLIMVGDVNNLKKTNDTFGHLFGDRLLLTITDAIKKSAPEGSFIARIGGDEIVLLVPKADEQAAELFKSGVKEILGHINENEIGRPSISWGYSVMHNGDEGYNDVFRAADAIMYEEKRKQREISISGVIPQKATGGTE